MHLPVPIPGLPGIKSPPTLGCIIMTALVFPRCLCGVTLRNYARIRILRRVYSSSAREENKSHTENVADEERQTHFGYETVSESEKERRVYEVFHNVAEKYDVMNDTMSGGVHRLWKDYFMERMGPMAGTKLIDVAGGTGDIAFRFLRYLENSDPSMASSLKFRRKVSQHTVSKLDVDLPSSSSDESSDGSDEDNGLHGRDGHATVCDITQAMLDVGKRKAEHQGFTHGISWLRGNAECLPVADNTYDVYSVAFGIRNMTHTEQVLNEAYRVLKPGGRFMSLEFSEVSNPLLRRLYDQYSFQVIPVMGQVIAGDWKSYQYLVESIRKFPNQEDFAALIREAGFKAVTYENLMFGVAAIHSGFKL